MNPDDELELGATPHAEDEVTEDELALIKEPSISPDEPEAEFIEESVEEVEEAVAEEVEEAGEVEEPVEEVKAKEEVMIPKARLDQEIRNRRNVENELNNYKEKERNRAIEEDYEKTSADKSEYIEKLENAFINGDMKEVANLFESRDNEIKRQAIHEIQRDVPEHIKQAQQKEEFDQIRSSIEEAFTFLRPDSPDFDQPLVDTIVTFAAAEAKKGKNPATALKDATSKVLLYEKPEEVEKFLVAQGLKEPKQVSKTKTKERMQSKLNASNNQHPEMSSTVSQDTVVPDFADMSEEDFDKLTEKEIERYMMKMEGGY